MTNTPRPYVLLTEEYSTTETQKLLDELPQWRRELALRFRHETGQRLCALAYIALCQALKEECGITEKPDFNYNEHGKPLLAQYPDIHFSLSHCQQAAGCLLSDRPCGLDIESIRQEKESLVRYTMNEAEAEEILSSPNPAAAFTRMWTRKEAVVKLYGTGISNDMKDLLPKAAEQGITLSTEDYKDFIISWATSPISPIKQTQKQ